MKENRLIRFIYLLPAALILFAQCDTRDRIDQSGGRKIYAVANDDFHIIFHQDFEDNKLGSYKERDYKDDWNNVGDAPNSRGRTFINDLHKGGRKSRGMQWNFPENSVGVTSDYGYIWRPSIRDDLEECYFSYSIMFKPGFNAVKSGKIPGLQGGYHKAHTEPGWDYGFGGFLIWKSKNKGEIENNPPQPAFYVYHHDQTSRVGDSYRWNDYTFDVSTDIWYDITFRIVMNTATATEIGGPDGLGDGIMEGYINGELWGQLTGLRLRNLASIGIDKMQIMGFFGGSNESFAALRDEWILLDNFYLWTYSDEYLRNNPSVKRGRQANRLNDKIYTPFDVLFGEETDPDPALIP